MRFGPLGFHPAAASALPDLALGFVCLAAWIAPRAFGSDIVAFMMLVMMLEFIIIHSSMFLGHAYLRTAPTREKIGGLVVLGGFYTLFVGGLSLAAKSAWPLVSFWGLHLNRIFGMIPWATAFMRRARSRPA